MARTMGGTKAEEAAERRMREGEYERRVLAELPWELQVVLSGMQVLFAFLLTVPFSTRFGDASLPQQAVFFDSLTCTVNATGLLIAPSAHRRVLWRQKAREHRLQTANRFSIADMTFLVLAMAGAMFLVTDLLFGSMTAALATAFLAYVRFVIPVRYRLNHKQLQ